MNRLLSITSLLFIASTLNAGNISSKKITVSTLNTVSHELVYAPGTGKKISELIWDAKGVKMLGFNVNYQKNENFYISFDYKTNIRERQSMMDDYDWLKDDRTEWSDWSNHPNTYLDKLTILDLAFNAKLKPIATIESNLIFGYKVENKRFKAYDGSFIYSTENGFRDDRFTSYGLGITYQETFETIYTGISLNKQYPNFRINSKLLLSPFVKASSKDNHHNRSFENSNHYSDTIMTSFDLGLEIDYSKDTSFEVSYAYIDYSKTNGITTRRYYADSEGVPAGAVLKYGGSGISNSYSMLNMSIIYKY